MDGAGQGGVGTEQGRGVRMGKKWFMADKCFDVWKDTAISTKTICYLRKISASFWGNHLKDGEVALSLGTGRHRLHYWIEEQDLELNTQDGTLTHNQLKLEVVIFRL